MISKIAGTQDIQKISTEKSIKKAQKEQQQNSRKIQKINTDNHAGTETQQNKPQTYKDVASKITAPITQEEELPTPCEKENIPATQIKEGTLEDYYNAQLALAMVKKDFLLRKN